MELIVSASGLEVTPQTIRSLSQRLDLAVDRLEAVLQKITVQIDHRPGTRSESGVTSRQHFDVACRIQLSLAGNEQIELDDMDNNLVELLERITERLGVIVSKKADDRKIASIVRKTRNLRVERSSSTLDSSTLMW